jgi:hypothetical protein
MPTRQQDGFSASLRAKTATINPIAGSYVKRRS